jgi:hypothetical protein
MEEQDLLHLTLPTKCTDGDVCIFVTEDQIYNKIDISHHCKEQDLEICGIHLETKASALIILSFYTDHSGDFNQFINRLNATLKYLYIPKSEF